MKMTALFLSLLLISGGAPSGIRSAQEKNEQWSAYKGAPDAHREALLESVNRMVDLQKQRQWDKIYDILPTAYKTESKESFVQKTSRGPRLINFVARAVTHSPIEEDEWLVVGCGTFLRERKISSWESVISGRLSGDKWFVSMVLLSGGERGLTRCDAGPAGAKP